MRVKYEYAGTNCTKSHLIVWFEIVTGSARVVKELHIPWSELTDRKVLGMLDRQIQKELKESWLRYEDTVFDIFND
uniref:DUF4160 domain-containing protein n=1 Tax=uncultured prokaryote TaxID=198431 RepID=A0A0H5QNR1_9ZZZZ|nr:hypothetical protein [uncultured prokaryote]